MQKQTKSATRAVALALILSVAWWYLHQATNREARELEALRREYIELLWRADALGDSAARASNVVIDPNQWAVIYTAELTAYSCAGIVTPGQRAMNCPHGVTTSGTIPRVGRTVACRPELLGRRVIIAGIGERVCEDTGGAITGNKIDVYVENISSALAFGRQSSKFTIKN